MGGFCFQAPPIRCVQNIGLGKSEGRNEDFEFYEIKTTRECGWFVFCRLNACSRMGALTG